MLRSSSCTWVNTGFAIGNKLWFSHFKGIDFVANLTNQPPRLWRLSAERFFRISFLNPQSLISFSKNLAMTLESTEHICLHSESCINFNLGVHTDELHVGPNWTDIFFTVLLSATSIFRPALYSLKLKPRPFGWKTWSLILCASRKCAEKVSARWGHNQEGNPDYQNTKMTRKKDVVSEVALYNCNPSNIITIMSMRVVQRKPSRSL